ncbi:uncharacterized protein LOC123192431 isoform X2 [Mangifera indica]|uniref:uncharacterized protein LOC123192431 isoform X2 n=1 Tax=Mangifera indica TaxID=29780 RepID=UPI001CFA82A4|nr:uncharacterized protein LOC123192431 isoform X2 [Mangifera indica]
MARIARAYPQSFLKAVNLVIGMVGIAMILYGLWIIRVWQRDMQDSSFEDSNSTAPRIYLMIQQGGFRISKNLLLRYLHIDGHLDHRNTGKQVKAIARYFPNTGDDCEDESTIRTADSV